MEEVALGESRVLDSGLFAEDSSPAAMAVRSTELDERCVRPKNSTVMSYVDGRRIIAAQPVKTLALNARKSAKNVNRIFTATTEKTGGVRLSAYKTRTDKRLVSSMNQASQKSIKIPAHSVGLSTFYDNSRAKYLMAKNIGPMAAYKTVQANKDVKKSPRGSSSKRIVGKSSFKVLTSLR